MSLWTFDIDFMNFVLGLYLIKPFTKYGFTWLSINFLNGREKERLRRIKELLSVLMVDRIYNLTIDR